MTSRDFCYWLQGFFEIAEEGREPIDQGNGTVHTPGLVMNDKQIRMVRRHLELVFKHEIDPSMPDPTGKLQKIHDGVPLTNESTLLRC